MKKKVSNFKSFLHRLGTQYLGDQIPTIASSMVYGTLISAVPCISFLFIFLNSFGVIDPVKELLTTYIINAVGGTTAEELISYIDLLTANAYGMGAVGLISFIVTFLLLINKIWKSLNLIFRTVPPKNIAKRFAEFLTVLFVGVILIIAFISLQSFFSDWFSTLLGRPAISSFAVFFGKLLPKLIGWFMIFLIIYYLPDCQIQFSSAVLGSFTASVFLYFLSFLFRNSVKFMVGYSLLYGSFGVLFIFLLYLYLAWTIILLGAEITYIHQFRPQYSFSSISGESPASNISELINVVIFIANNYKKGKGGTGAPELESNLLIPPSRLSKYTKLMLENKFIISVDNNGHQSYIPSKPLDQLYISDIVDKIFGIKPIENNELETVGDAVCLQFKEEGITSFADITVENLLERV